MSSSTASRLEGLIGLEGAKGLVRRLFQSGSESHAVLFYGPEGSGKEELARALAELWLCMSPTPDGGADGTCRACGAFARDTNPDLLLVAPMGLSSIILNKQIENSAPKEDDPRPLRGFFRTGPLMSRYKVALISDAHRMNEAASNALLKTLEEPFPHAKLVLTTDTVGGIRPTILSRCLAAACSLPTRSQIATAFPQATDVDVRLAQGAPGRLQRILKYPDRYRAVAEFADGLTGRSPAEALVVSEQFRWIAEKLDVGKIGARAANAEALSLLAVYLAREPGAPAEWAQYTIEAHRRVLGNGSAPVVFDALFAQMLASPTK